MSVTASFQPDRVSAAPGETAALALHLQNNTAAERKVTLRPVGELASQTVLQTETIFLDPNEHFEVAVIVDANTSLNAGSHDCVIEVVDGDETSTANATVEINASEAWSARLEPQRSKSANAGRHKVAVENRGNIPVMVELAPSASPEVVTEIAASAVNVDPGKTAKVELRIAPPTQFWNGPSIEHPFSLVVDGSNGDTVDLDGVYEQGPRLRPWFLPAAVGIAGSLIIGTLAWFTLLKPSVTDIAQEEAAALDAAQQDDLDLRVADIEVAAEEASELPLGRPADVQLSVASAEATSSTAGQVFSESTPGRRLSITDVVFQNPTAAVGRLQLIRQVGDEPDADEDAVLLDQELANFRDLDFHFVAPLSIDSGETIVLRLSCDTAGPGTDECEASATIVGFVDDV